MTLTLAAAYRNLQGELSEGTMTEDNKPPKRPYRIKLGYSIPAAARELGLSESTVRRACDRGEIRVVQLGGARRVPPAEVRRIKDEFVLPAAE
jgi:excisionase family DNA binding protein